MSKSRFRISHNENIDRSQRFSSPHMVLIHCNFSGKASSSKSNRRGFCFAMFQFPDVTHGIKWEKREKAFFSLEEIFHFEDNLYTVFKRCIHEYNEANIHRPSVESCFAVSARHIMSPPPEKNTLILHTPYTCTFSLRWPSGFNSGFYGSLVVQFRRSLRTSLRRSSTMCNLYIIITSAITSEMISKVISEVMSEVISEISPPSFRRF